MDIATLLGLTPTLYEIGKDVVDLALKKKDKELSQAVSKWQQAQLDFLKKFSEFQVEYTQIQGEIRKLKNWEATKETLKFRDNMYWKDGDDSPFCSSCADAKSILVHLHKDANDWHYCPSCKWKEMDGGVVNVHVLPVVR